ncbi:hypothetical protein Tco_0628795 [Tanacetum coccineum]|uniref:Uncharacterized protein n=1 Tax=Tanacetum coccineum TaxID=301880 RepID=A0ABQ4WRH4_9ASTR
MTNLLKRSQVVWVDKQEAAFQIKAEVYYMTKSLQYLKEAKISSHTETLSKKRLGRCVEQRGRKAKCRADALRPGKNEESTVKSFELLGVQTISLIFQTDLRMLSRSVVRSH